MKLIRHAISILLFFLNPRTWLNWSVSKEKIHNEFYWIWLKYCYYILQKFYYPRIKNNIARKLLQNQEIKIAFIVFDTSKWSVDTIYQEFAIKKGFHPVIIVFPDIQFPGGSSESVKYSYAFFEKKGYNVQYGYNPTANQYLPSKIWKEFDIVFFDTPWLRKEKTLKIETIGASALTCYIPYGAILAGKIEQEHYNMPNHSFAWRIFPELAWHKQQYNKHNYLSHDYNVVPLGYPKLDIYSQKLTDPEKVWKLGLNPNIRRVIWAPHWTIYNVFPPGQFSTFHLIYKQMLEYAKNHPEIDWLFKPHPVLRSTIIAQKLMSESEVDNYYQQWDCLPNGQVSLDGNFWDYFRTSDALITDSVSFLVEYLPSKKPIFRIDSGYGSYNEITQQIISNYYTGKTMDDIIEFIENIVIPENDYLYNERMKSLKLMQNPGVAGKSIVEYIINTITSEK